MKTFKTYDDTILVEGKKYRYSGCCDNLYNSFSWIDMKCKILKIEDDKIYIYDYDDMKEIIYTNRCLKNNNITFKKHRWFSIY